MIRFTFGLILILLAGCPLAWSGEALSQRDAIALAENFIAKNGYTDGPRKRIQPKLDLESIERTDDRDELLLRRHNKLQAKATGAKPGRLDDSQEGWSIAFDYTPQLQDGTDVCRVVTMNLDGSDIRIEHRDGKRAFFVGFD